MKNSSPMLCFSLVLFSLLSSPSSSARIFSSVVPSAAPSPAVTTTETDLSSFTQWNILDLTDFKNLPDLSKLNISSLHVSPTVDSVCSGTDYAAECVVSILPLLRNFRKFEPKPIDVLRMELSALYEKANATLDLAKRLIVDQSTPRDVADVLDLCVENYESLLVDLNDASVAVDNGDVGRLDSLVSAAIADVVTCSDAFTESPELESPMANVDAFLKKLCSNVLAISHMIYM
ncbi:Pectinesterase inhibitor [Cardamine amara subsp. amara]|uniref:Pectinesterase inhibitor n=1 Tax=Cardamine amara subsp. amara TaxID=228776 RepID=A0ABD1BWX6_CARAN